MPRDVSTVVGSLRRLRELAAQAFSPPAVCQSRSLRQADGPEQRGAAMTAAAGDVAQIIIE
jgi:hypothetical protein